MKLGHLHHMATLHALSMIKDHKRIYMLKMGRKPREGILA